MNKFFYTIIGAVFLIACSKQPKNQFTKITVPKENFKISYLKGFKKNEDAAGEKISYIDTLKYKKKFPLCIIEVGQGQRRIFLYAPLGANIDITAKDGEFHFSGDYKMENEFLQQLDTTCFRPMMDSTMSYIYMNPEKEKIVMSMVDSIHNAARDLIEQHQAHLDAEFVRLMHKNILYTAAYYKDHYQKLLISDFKDYKATDSLYDYRASIPLEDEEALEFDIYLNYVSSTIGISYAKDKLQSSVEKINSLASEKIKFALLSEFLRIYIGLQGINEISQRIYDDYIQKYPHAKREVKEIYAKKIKTAVGEIAPDFTAYKTDGKEVSLSDFRGKLVYVDFWATWCGPCQDEIPHLKKLEKQYHDKEIVFLSVSLDPDNLKKEWKEMIKKESLAGVQVRSQGGFKSNAAQQYGILGIPTFLLIGKQGEIISFPAPRPSSGEGTSVKNLIDRHL